MVAAALAMASGLAAPANPVLLYASHGDPRVGSQLLTSSSAGRHALDIKQPESAGALTGAIRPDGRLIAFISGTTLWTAPLTRRSVAIGIGRSGSVLRASVTRQRDGSWTGAIRAATNAQGPLSWSPDGSKLLFNRPPRLSDSGAILKLAMTDLGASTSEQRLLVGPEAERDSSARFSPNGAKILFTRFVNLKGDRLMTVNANGSGLTELPGDDGLWNYGAWSPDGTKITAVRSYSALTPGTPGVYVMNSRGEGVEIVEGTDGRDFAPFFSPSGTEIVFARSLRSGSFEQKDIYRVSLDRRSPPRAFIETPGITEIPLQWISLRP